MKTTTVKVKLPLNQLRSIAYGVFAFYLFFSISTFVAGAVSADVGSYLSDPDGCLSRPRRIEALFPSYRFGCYLFSINEHTYGPKPQTCE